MKIAIITAGGAGMFCGSCMQDNTLVRTLRLAGEDAVLVPTYTPIRVDEENVSAEKVFLGGINVYLDSAVPGWKRLPRWATDWLNRPSLIQWLTRFGGSTDAAKLGALTLDMLKGAHGPQRREVVQFSNYLCHELKPDIIVFSNALLSGVLSELRPRFPGQILCLLQGDDVFLEDLTNRWKPAVLSQLKQNCTDFDGFLTHSSYYKDYISGYLELPHNKFRQIPLTIDARDYSAPQLTGSSSKTARRTIGYFARICPQKGVHNLLDAAIKVLPEFPEADIAIAGYLSEHDRSWFKKKLAAAQNALPNRIHWLGSPNDRARKLQMVNEFDLLCVPTDYHEPKGLYVLEAAMTGVPSLLPNHGAFPELIDKLQCGTLYDASDSNGLSESLRQFLSGQLPSTSELPGRAAEQFGMASTAPQLVNAISSFQ